MENFLLNITLKYFLNLFLEEIFIKIIDFIEFRKSTSNNLKNHVKLF